METQHQWRTLSGRWIKAPIAEEIETTLAKEVADGNQLKVCIGTDSQVKACSRKRGSRETEFATVIVFIRKGKGVYVYTQRNHYAKDEH